MKNRISNGFILLLIAIIASSCVYKRQIVYLQDKNYDLEHSFPKDSIVKSVGVKSFEYKLEVNDIVSIEVSSLSPSEYNVFTNPDSQNKSPLLSGYILARDGTVELPVIGKVKLEGLTVNAAQVLVQQEIDKYLESPIVNLKLLSFKVTILGEVKQPGTYNSYTNTMNVFDVVGMAGDLTDVADRANIKLIRQENDSAKVIYLNLLDDQVLASNYFHLLPNDILVIPPLKVKNFRQYQLQNFGLILSTLTVISLLIIRF
ncbi:MAG TPA: polysaccharide biosynthesis/export family protein [Fulvivirga sp.]|nr:polysaccharide biosynthesis/export family protein [Fulvivirga sp.]